MKVRTLFAHNHQVKITFQAAVQFLYERALHHIIAERPGNNPAGPSGINSSVQAVQLRLFYRGAYPVSRLFRFI